MPPDPARVLCERLDERARLDSLQGGASNRYRASEAGGCKRQIWYRVSGYLPWPENPNEGMANVVGTVIHDLTRSMFEANGITIDGIIYNEDATQDETDQMQHVLEDGLILSSRSDGRLGTDTLLEIKSVDQFTFKALEEAYKTGGNAAALQWILDKRPYYYGQTMITAEMLGAKMIYLLIVVRDNLRIGLKDRKGVRNCIIYPFDKAAFEKEVKRFRAVEKARHAGTPPPADYEDGSKPCEYCRFYYLCHGKKQNLKHPSEAAGE